MASKITALATASAAVRDFDDTTLNTKPAFVLVTPVSCVARCEALVSRADYGVQSTRGSST